jgi:dTDP-4-amino-4,6-dideoxygalactose transaminase
MTAPQTYSTTVIPDRPAICGGEPLFPESFRFIQPTLPPLGAAISQYEPVYQQGMITNSGLVERFERAVAERVGVPHCVAVSSCTAGLMLVIRALGLEGEIILPSFTFFATGHAVLWNNLKPVLADCDRQTWTIDPADVERKITPRTSAIIGVHIYGNPSAIDELSAIAARHRVKLIFDAAHAFGSRRRGAPIGRFGDVEVFSLSPTKTLVCGEGGLVTTADAVLARRLRAMRNYGDDGSYDCEILGMNARMSEFQAALGLAGLDSVDTKIRRHNEIASMYTSGLSSVPGIGFQTVCEGNVNTFKDYSIHVAESEFGRSRDELVAALAAENIPTRKYFYPALQDQRLYRQFARGQVRETLGVTGWLSRGIVSLPIYHSLRADTVEKVIAGIRRFAEYQTNA